MARALPVGSDVAVANPAFSALAALGLEESVVQMGSADAPILMDVADAIPDVVAPAATNTDLESPVTAAIASVGTSQAFVVVESLEGAPELIGPAPAEETEAGVAESASDPLLVIVPFDFSAQAKGIAIPIQVEDDLSFLDRKIVFDFRSEGLDLSAAFGADSAEIAVSDAARPGGGGGGPGGGGSGGGVSAEYLSGSANGTTGYDILIQFKGTGWTADLQSAFKNAADYFTAVITTDIGGGGRIGKVVVDDLYVTAEVKAIDGEGGILGQAGPTNVWLPSELTAAGQMQFDVADALDYASAGLWDDIVTHELMHVLGLGSLWNYGANPLVVGGEYIGPNAVLAYDQVISGTQTSIPVEQQGGSGTAGSHWDEETLGNELMTGYIDDSNYLSKFSVMSLADLGYKVNYFDYPHD